MDDIKIQQLQQSLKDVTVECPICISYIVGEDESLWCNHCHVMLHSKWAENLFKNAQSKVKWPQCKKNIKFRNLEDFSIIYKRQVEPIHENLIREMKKHKKSTKKSDFACTKHKVMTDKYCSHCNKLYCQICFNDIPDDCQITNINRIYEKEFDKVKRIVTEIPMIKLYFIDKNSEYYKLSSSDHDLIMEMALEISTFSNIEINSLLNYIQKCT